MTPTMNNLEKLIQMATIEQMYSMLQKIKKDNKNENNKFQEAGGAKKSTTTKAHGFQGAQGLRAQGLRAQGTTTTTAHGFQGAKNEECKFSNETYLKQNDILIGTLLNEITYLKTEINIHTEKLKRNNDEFWKLSIKFAELEKELFEIKGNTNNNSRFLCQQIRGQQLLTSYPGFSNGSPTEEVKEEAHIKLKIEEKCKNNCYMEEEDEPVEKDLGIEKQDDKEEEEEDESEEEVGTEDEAELLVKTEEEKPIEVQKVEEEDEEEEVFEIEIEDVTYFATNEENGILYEMTPDGDVGKNVGIIKDGEPIFN